MKNCVYRFLNDNDEIIYIGKAKDLKQRLKNHCHLPDKCYEERKIIEYISFDTEDEMDFAERYFVPKVKPKYNTVYKYRELNLKISEFDSKKWSLYKPSIYQIKNEQKQILIRQHRKSYEDMLQEIKNREDKKYEINTTSKKVIIPSTGEIFGNMIKAANYFNMDVRDVYESSERTGFCWKNHPSYYGCKLSFQYYDEYLKYYNKNPKHYQDYQESYTRQIICLTTDCVFPNVYKIEYEYNIPRYRVTQCCKNYANYAGTYDNKPLVWMWYDEYKNMTNDDIQHKIDKAYNFFNKRNCSNKKESMICGLYQGIDI